jgi:HlyD family secretion protein
MDIKLERQKGIKGILKKKNIPYLFALLVVMLVMWAIFSDHSSTLKIDTHSISVAEAVKGRFNDYMRVTGEVQPVTTVQLSPLEIGIVKSIVVEEGTKVKKGDVLMVLINNTLNLSILDAEAQLAEKQNFLRNTQITMEQERLSLEQEKIELDMEMERKKRIFKQNDLLSRDGLISKEETLQSKEDYILALNKRRLVIARQKQDATYRKVQMNQMEESLEQMRRNMKLIRERVNNLTIKSPVDGEVGRLDVMLGQSLTTGQNIGQINDLSDYRVETKIDEYYIDRVRTGLQAIFDQDGKKYKVFLQKVYPEVRDGQFRADFQFISNHPENICIGQTYYLDLQLGQPVDAVLIPRGSFYQSTGGCWIFVVDRDGEKAHKRRIRIGRQNPQYYEVLGGLSPGEKVIVSSYEGYGKNDVLVLNK